MAFQIAANMDTQTQRVFQVMAGVCALLIPVILFVGLGWYVTFGTYQLNTKYAPGFTQKAWSRVSTGMRCKEVENILGAPVKEETIESNGSTGKVLWYSDSRGRGDTYYVYYLRLDDHDIVTEKNRSDMD